MHFYELNICFASVLSLCILRLILNVQYLMVFLCLHKDFISYKNDKNTGQAYQENVQNGFAVLANRFEFVTYVMECDDFSWKVKTADVNKDDINNEDTLFL